MSIPRCFFRRAAFPVLVLALSACSGPRGSSPPDPTAMSIATPSGVTFAATFYSAAKLPAPTCILMTMPGTTLEAWDPFVMAARREGIASVVLDVTPRGAGGNRLKSDVRAYSDADWKSVLEGVLAVKHAVIEQGADPEDLAVGGAGITANLALRYAHGDPDIQATILLSPGLEYSGITSEETMRAFGRRPVFLAVAEGDAYAHSSSLQLQDIAQGFCELRVYDGAAHGTDLFGASENVVEQLLLWLKPILIRSSA